MPIFVVTVALEDDDPEYANRLADAIRASLKDKRAGFVIRDEVDVTVSIYQTACPHGS